MDTQAPEVIAVGYSVRALAEASINAGLACVAIDHFGDTDTRQYANNRWIEFQLTEGGLIASDTCISIKRIVREISLSGNVAVFLLAGGMENLGGSVAQLRKIATVLGPTERQRAALRNPEFLNDVAHAAGIKTPQLRSAPISDSGWLWKPRSSAGGLKITRSNRAKVELESGYFQEFIPGEQIGVSCLVSNSKCELLGATSGFDALEWPGPSEFIYRGSIGPIALSHESQTQIEYLCHEIHNRIGYNAWLQFDFIRDQRGDLWLLECNPRWTAGMEILSHTNGLNPVQELLSSNGFATLNRTVDRRGETVCCAKAVVYATNPTAITDEMIAEINQLDGIADRPHAPQLIECGHPIVTVRAGLKHHHAAWNEGENRSRLLDDLREKAEQVNRILGG